MKIRLIAIAAVAAVATSAALANAPSPVAAEPQTAPRPQTLVRELAAGMREVLRAVTPEISLPAVEVKLPTLDPRR
jgi:hypothetical protein